MSFDPVAIERAKLEKARKRIEKDEKNLIKIEEKERKNIKKAEKNIIKAEKVGYPSFFFHLFIHEYPFHYLCSMPERQKSTDQVTNHNDDLSFFFFVILE
eukprot:TRINITY_DN26332_c0_g1_i2.p1 TRINITY_DN26332_c0_g1~~TRINITY_DN26332_c0_g1_i2.p1  ORF type:complete len:100 (+),score=17.41 TRINITY_DN26332_c0_g1_i2:59-358(+)